MKYLKSLSIFFLLFLLASGIEAQNPKLEKANQLYEDMAYPSAIKFYEKVLKKDPDNQEAKEKLAESYWKTGNLEKAEEQYADAVKSPGANSQLLFDYARVLQANGKYDEASSWYSKYADKGGNSGLANKMKEGISWAKEGMKDSTRYKIVKQNFNSSEDDFSAIPYERGVVFASSRGRGFFSRPVDARTNSRFFDLYYSDLTGTKKAMVKRIKGKVNSRFHDGPAVFSADGNTMYFTRSNTKKGSNGKTHFLEIFQATKNGKKWGDITPLSFNSEEYSTGHPALSSDGSYIIFASDRPGGFGGTDLYMSRKSGDSWSEPVNLGPSVNTTEDELFPYIHPDGVLFFSSNGHPGFGGLDVFSAKGRDGRFSGVRNAGYPLNGPKDDFGVSFIPKRAIGYFSSDREGDDNIYRFKRKTSVEIIVIDSRNKKPLADTKIEVLDGSSKKEYMTDSEGKATFYGDWNKEYFLTLSKTDYDVKKEKISTKDIGPADDYSGVIEINRSILFSVTGTVTDAETGNPLPGTSVRLIPNKGQETQVTTDADGKYFLEMDENTEYYVIAQKGGYVAQWRELNTAGQEPPQDFVQDFALEKGQTMLVEGTVIAKDTREPLADAFVRAIATEKREEVKTGRSRSDGKFLMVLDPKMDQYLLVGAKERYFSSRVELPVPSEVAGDTTLLATIEMIRYEVGALVKIIYYEYDKSDITLTASKELYEIIYFLIDNPEAKVELSAHTDSRGSDRYNEKLSQRRAESAVEFITGRGVGKDRIAAKGYGEQQLVNNCRDGKNCSEAEHALNRRSEIRVTGLEDEKSEEGGRLKGDKDENNNRLKGTKDNGSRLNGDPNNTNDDGGEE